MGLREDLKEIKGWFTSKAKREALLRKIRSQRSGYSAYDRKDISDAGLYDLIFQSSDLNFDSNVNSHDFSSSSSFFGGGGDSGGGGYSSSYSDSSSYSGGSDFGGGGGDGGGGGGGGGD